MIPLYFQAVRGESPATVGLRLIVPSLATPIGGVIAGSMMHRGYRLSYNVRMGTSMMLLGNVFALTMGDCGGRWRDVLYLVPANLGLGLTNPSLLFSFICLFEHKGKDHACTSSCHVVLTGCRTSCGDVDRLSDPFHGDHIRRHVNLGRRAEHAAIQVTRCPRPDRRTR